MMLVYTYSPAWPAWGDLSFVTKKRREAWRGGSNSLLFFSGSAFPHAWQPRAEQLLLLGTFSLVGTHAGASAFQQLWKIGAAQGAK